MYVFDIWGQYVLWNGHRFYNSNTHYDLLNFYCYPSCVCGKKTYISIGNKCIQKPIIILFDINNIYDDEHSIRKGKMDIRFKFKSYL